MLEVGYLVGEDLLDIVRGLDWLNFNPAACKKAGKREVAISYWNGCDSIM